MQFRILILFLIILFGCQSIYTTSLTDEFSLIFQPTFGDKRLMINKKYAYQSDSVEINTLRFYLSNFKFYNKNKLVFKETNSYHLMDLSDVNSCLFWPIFENPTVTRSGKCSRIRIINQILHKKQIVTVDIVLRLRHTAVYRQHRHRLFCQLG